MESNKVLGCKKHGMKGGTVLSLKVKSHKFSIPVYLCNSCKKIYVNRNYHIGNIRELNYKGRYIPVEKIDGPTIDFETLEEDERNTIDVKSSRLLDQGNKEVLISEDYLNNLHYFTGLELKIRVYPVILELIRLTKSGTIKWKIGIYRRKYSDDKKYYVVYEVVGKNYITFSSSEDSDAFRLCDIPCVCIQDCTLLEKKLYKTLSLEKRQKLGYKKDIIDNAYLRATTIFDDNHSSSKKEQHKLITKDINISVKKPVQKVVKENVHRQEDTKDISSHNPQPVMDSQDIGIKDFVVRQNTFKCMHNSHNIQNIDATVRILRKKDGKLIDKKLSAGYCPKCRIYFILESTFENLKMYGIPLCRISDEKTYLSSNNNNMQLASESILMQYGYNVSQTEGLSKATRHKILAAMVDNNIMSKSDIISYLDFFISQRSSQSRYEIAISKWEIDKAFIARYRQGEYTQYGVNAIYR